jgi:uncharacterized YccA/Bax inhibitor family protein
MRTSNPAFSEALFQQRTQAVPSAGTMTVNGTANKTMLLLLLALVTAAFTWNQTLGGPPSAGTGWMIGGGIGGFIAALATIFKPQWSPISAPIYALLEGLFLGAISARYEALMGGITTQAVLLTLCIAFAMLFTYRAGWIKVTEKFRSGVVMATGGIALMYLLSLAMSFFGASIPFLHSNSLLGIGISLAIIVVASLNLLLDFDFIEKGAQYGAPSYMEWFGAFGLMVTLVWLYLEMLRLLAKISSRE